MKHYFIGTCITIFDEDGDCMFDIYRDASELAYSFQNDTVKIDENQFFKNVVYHNQFDNNHSIQFFYDSGRDVYIAYDKNKDFHYFYQ